MPGGLGRCIPDEELISVIPEKRVLLNGLPTGLPLRIETPYLDLAVEARTAIDGSSETWAIAKTPPAFTVGLLCAGTGPGDPPKIVLYLKRRLKDDPLVIKTPGGFDRPGQTMGEKILADTGIVINEAELNPLGRVMGHATILTPIRLYWSICWEIVQRPRDGVIVLDDVPLDRAAFMAHEGKIEDDASVELILKLYFLWREGNLNI